MNELTLPDGSRLRYAFDARGDKLTVHLADSPEPAHLAESPMPDMPRVTVLRDTRTDRVVALRVNGVQSLILESIVLDLALRAVPEGGARSVAPETPHGAALASSPDPTVASTPPSPPGPDASGHADEDGEAKPRKKKRKRRKKRRKRSDQSEAAPATDTAESRPEPVTAPDSAPTRDDRAAAAPAVPIVDEAVDDTLAAVEPIAIVNDVDDDIVAAIDPAPILDEVVDDTGVVVEPSYVVDDIVTDLVEAVDYPTPVVDDAVDVTTEATEPDPFGDAAESLPAPKAQRAAEPTEGATNAPEAFQSFGVNEKLLRAVADMGFSEPTPIQRRAIPDALLGHDLVGLAQTGTGKTLAFLMPTLHRILETPTDDKRPRLLVITPTRELAVQVAKEAEALLRHTDLDVVTVYGGADMGRQTSALKRGVAVVVATPGRLLDHVRRRNVRLDAVVTLVLDEADRMLDMGFLPDVRQILHQLPEKRQTLLFGATMPPAIEALSLQFQHDPDLIEIARQLPPESIKQLLYPVGRHLKAPLLVHLLNADQDLERVLVFTERRSEADVVSRLLRDAGLPVAVMHGDVRQRERERSLSQLKDGTARILVATNVAARGLDIEAVSHVVNYDVPQTVDEYIHRIGRTARADATGTAFTFMSPGDQWMIKRIESALERELPRVEAEGFNYDVPTPSWAQPSAEEIVKTLSGPKNVADVSRRMGRRR